MPIQTIFNNSIPDEQNLAKEKAKYPGYFQPISSDDATNARGRLRINRQLRSMRIELFSAANFSTFQHESAHMMLEMVADMVQTGACSNYLKNEFNTIMDYLGTTPDAWFSMTPQERTEYHEKFAESFEKYLYEGKAPSVTLRDAFRRFKSWLMHIYDAIRNGRFINNNGLRYIKLNDDIRGVFDRMLASDEEIRQSEETDNLRDILVRAENLGVSNEELTELRALVDNQVAEAQDKLRGKLLKHKLKERTKEYRDELKAANGNLLTLFLTSK